MRSHAEIIRDAGGYNELRERLGLPSDDAKVKFWFHRNSIPAEWWVAITLLGLTSAEELALAAHRRREQKDRAA